MNKFKLLKFGKCYLNREGDFAIFLVGGDYDHGYQFIASHAHPAVWLGNFQLRSRVVTNDGNWMEIHPDTFKAAAACHSTGHVLKLPAVTGEELPVISKKY